MATGKHILLERLDGGIVRLTLNRPDALNAFTFAMYIELAELLESISADPKVRTVILTGAGRGFCAGHDTISGGNPDWVPQDLGFAQRAFYLMRKMSGLPVQMQSLSQPIIAAVNGPAAGIGFSLALAADICIAADTAKFVNATLNVGTGCEFGLSYLLPRAVGIKKAAEIMYTTRPILSEEAERIGLVSKVAAKDDLQRCAMEVADQIAQNIPLGISMTKKVLMSNLGAGSLAQAIEYENAAVALVQTTDDKTEKVKARFEKRPPKFLNT